MQISGLVKETKVNKFTDRGKNMKINVPNFYDFAILKVDAMPQLEKYFH